MRMTDKLKKTDRALLELLSGIAVFGVFCQAAGLFFPISSLKYAIGLWGGIIWALLAAVHIWRSLNKAFSCDEKSAARLIAGGYVMRYLAAAALLLLLHYSNAGYVLAGFLGVMGLKTGAYLQPVTHKFYNKLFHETDPVPQPLAEEGENASESIEEKEVKL